MSRIPPLRAYRFIDSRLFWSFVSLALGPAAAVARSPKWLVFFSYARERIGAERGAGIGYAKAVDRIRNATDTAALRWKQAAQFFLERNRYRRGEPCAEDPLLRCAAVPSGEATKDAVGFFKAEFIFSGLLVMGILPKGCADSIELFLDGTKIRGVNVVVGAFWSSFSFKITRRALSLFPKSSTLSVFSADGQVLSLFSGEESLRLSIPHGSDGRGPLISGERRIDKKGVPVPSASELSRSRREFLEIYTQARAFFKERFGKELFLAYGTLLGYRRQAGFIEGDDDFDAGFMADSDDPVSVKGEVIEMVIALVKAGFSVSFNRRGRLFRLHARGALIGGEHIDIHSFWVQGGKVYAHNDFCALGEREDYVPAAEGFLEGVRVYAPARTELFLGNHYGPGWKVPDPGFANYFASADPAVLKNLSGALISPAEYVKARERIEEARLTDPEVGEFVSIGARDLYPLSGRDEDLE